MKRLRNRIIRKFMICRDKIVDCKSAHAGSIPASASTFESPADYGLRGFFMAAEKGDVFSKMKLKAAGCRLVYKVIDERTIVSVNTVGKQEHSAVYNQAKKRWIAPGKSGQPVIFLRIKEKL